MAMAIERNNSFHLMLSDDELGLLRMLAERDGLNASDYLRTLLRREAAGSSAAAMRHAMGVAALVGGGALTRPWKGEPRVAKKARAKRKKSASRG
jgi:hypothetical protein